MDINIDKRIYSDACIAKAVYSLADKYVIERHILSDDEENLVVISKTKECSNDEIRLDVYSSLNDYNLRCIIEAETHDIRTLLYAKAFADCDDVDASDID